MAALVLNLKQNLILEHSADAALLQSYITAAVAYAESYTERTLNGESKVVVNKDGQDIIVF